MNSGVTVECYVVLLHELFVCCLKCLICWLNVFVLTVGLTWVDRVFTVGFNII